MIEARTVTFILVGCDTCGSTLYDADDECEMGTGYAANVINDAGWHVAADQTATCRYCLLKAECERLGGHDWHDWRDGRRYVSTKDRNGGPETVPIRWRWCKRDCNTTEEVRVPTRPVLTLVTA